MNIQNIPRKDKLIKRCFVPKLDAFLLCDYMQIEYRLLAYYLHTVGYPEMTEMFKAGKDFHTESTIGVLKLNREPTDEERQIGKTFNFSLIYGGGVGTIINQLQCSPGEAMAMLKNFHQTWPGIGWQTRFKKADKGTLLWFIDQRVEQRGYLTTLWGRHLHPASEHKRLNALIQGCAADLMRAGLLKTWRWLRDQNMRSHLVNSVHDELILDCAADELPSVATAMPSLMDHPPVSEVIPIGVDIEWSPISWADKREYDADTFSEYLAGITCRNEDQARSAVPCS